MGHEDQLHTSSTALSHQAIVHDLRGLVALAGSLLQQAVDTPDDATSRNELLALAVRCIEQTARLLDDAGPHSCDDLELRDLELTQVIHEVAVDIPGLEVDCGDRPRSPDGTDPGLAIVEADAITLGGDATVENRSAGGLRMTASITR